MSHMERKAGPSDAEVPSGPEPVHISARVIGLPTAVSYALNANQRTIFGRGVAHQPPFSITLAAEAASKVAVELARGPRGNVRVMSRQRQAILIITDETGRSVARLSRGEGFLCGRGRTYSIQLDVDGQRLLDLTVRTPERLLTNDSIEGRTKVGVPLEAVLEDPHSWRYIAALAMAVVPAGTHVPDAKNRLIAAYYHLTRLQTTSASRIHRRILEALEELKVSDLEARNLVPHLASVARDHGLFTDAEIEGLRADLPALKPRGTATPTSPSNSDSS